MQWVLAHLETRLATGILAADSGYLELDVGRITPLRRGGFFAFGVLGLDLD